MKIINIEALQILDSRGNPTLQVDVFLEDGSSGRFCVPSGASTGIHEACELRDGNENMYFGKSVLTAVDNVYQIRKHVVDKSFNQVSLDKFLIELDGTENKSLLGANAILGVSVAFAKASAKFYNLSLNEYLYRLVNEVNLSNKTISKLGRVNLFANVINGGLHSGNNLNIQEFMIIPDFENVVDSVRAVAEVYACLKDIIAYKYGKSEIAVGDEGGFAPNISKASEALDLLEEAIEKANYTGKMFLAMDAAASDFYDKDSGKYEVEKGLSLDVAGLCEYYNELIRRYPIISIEDPYAEDDFEGFNYFLKNVKQLKFKNFLNDKKRILVVGDDLLVTNPKRIEMAKKGKLCDSLLLKINQIGTLTESLNAHLLAKSSNWHTIVSHRSGETVDDFISDLAVALSCSIKLGAPARGERVAKYNRLLNIYNK